MRTYFDAILVVFLLALVVHLVKQNRRIGELENRAAAAEGNIEVFWKVTDTVYRLEAQSRK